MLSLAARDSGGGAEPGRYLPVSTPCPSGDHTIWPMPLAAHRGMTACSGRRQSMEYWGWLETNGTRSREPAALVAFGGRPGGTAALLRAPVGAGGCLDGRRRPVAEADVPGLALTHDLGECLHRLLQRRARVVAVALVEVDVVGAQP